MSLSGGAWTVTTASVRGAAHERNGLPNQDAVTVYRVSVPDGIVAAVSDGHGGARYVRSADGAKAAVQVACAVGARYAPEVAGATGDHDRLQKVARKIADQLVTSWRADVTAHLRDQPFTDEERERADSPLDDDPVVAYGATLLCAIALAGTVVLLQLGDGDVVVVDAGGAGRSPMPADDRLVGNATTSLCLPDAAQDVRIVVLDGAGTVPTLVMLASDGYGNSFADAGWRSRVAADLRERLQDAGHDGLEESLHSWLQESAVAGGDDVTLAVLSRAAHDDGDTPTPLAGDAGEPTPAAGIAAPPPSVAGGGRARRGWLLAAVAIGLGVLAVVLAVATLRGGPTQAPAESPLGGNGPLDPAVGGQLLPSPDAPPNSEPAEEQNVPFTTPPPATRTPRVQGAGAMGIASCGGSGCVYALSGDSAGKVRRWTSRSP